MAGRDVYQIGQPTITKPAAANFVAEELFPGRGRRTAYQRIHSRITEAQRKGELPQGQSISADVFFGWAVEQKGWEALRSVRKLEGGSASNNRYPRPRVEEAAVFFGYYPVFKSYIIRKAPTLKDSFPPNIQPRIPV